MTSRRQKARQKKAPAEEVEVLERVEPESESPRAPSRPVPRLKIHPPRQVAKASTPVTELEDSPITPPPPVSKAEMKAAVELLLGPTAFSRAVSRRQTSPGLLDIPLDDTDSSAASSNTSSKRKRAASNASSLAGRTPSTVDEDDDGVGMEYAEEEEVDKLDDESEEEVAAPVDVPFSVPCDGANSTVTVPDTVSFKELMSELADTLSIAPKEVKVAYRFSTDPRSAPWSHLKTTKDLEGLMQKAREAIENPKKGKSARVFAVELKDIVPSDSHSGTKGKNKKDKDAGKPKKKKSHNKSDSEDDSELDPEKISAKKKSATQWIAQLEADNHCDEHVGKSCVKYATHHHHLTKQEIASWAIFMTHNWTSTTVPPKQLKLGDAERKAPKTRSTATAATSELPLATQPSALMPPSTPVPNFPMAVPGAYHPAAYGFNHPAYIYPPPMPPMQQFYGPGNMPGSSRHGRRGAYYEDSMPSSDPPEEVEDITLFPRVSEWLVQLDYGPRGADGHDFAHFVALFEQLKYTRICDIADNMTPDMLVARCEAMAEGTAQRIISYAKTDTKNIRRKQMGRKGHYY